MTFPNGIDMQPENINVMANDKFLKSVDKTWYFGCSFRPIYKMDGTYILYKNKVIYIILSLQNLGNY